MLAWPRNTRFDDLGVINDPDCTPGDAVLVISIDVSIQNPRGLLESANFPIRQEALHSSELRVPPAMPGLIPFIPP